MKPETTDTEEDKLLMAADTVDWGQVIANGGPPCFHIEDAVNSHGLFRPQWRFCLRAKRWEGHSAADHEFVSLEALVRRLIQKP